MTGTYENRARSGHTTNLLDNSLLIFGGEDMSERFTNSLFSYALDTHQWSEYNLPSENIPHGRSGHTSVAYNNALYIFGGDSHPKTGRLNDLWKLTIDKSNSNAIFELLSIKTSNINSFIPERRTKHSCVCYDSYMIVFGGWDWENAFPHLSIIDLNTAHKHCLQWSQIKLNDLPERIWHTSHILNVQKKGGCFLLQIIIIAGEDKQTFLQNDIFIIECQFNYQSNEEIVSNENNEQKQSNIESTADMDLLIFEGLKNDKHWLVYKLDNIPFSFKPRYGHSSNLISCLENRSSNEMITDYYLSVFGGYEGEMAVLNDFWLIHIQCRQSFQINSNQSEYKLMSMKSVNVFGENIESIPSPRHAHSSTIIFDENGKCMQMAFYGGLNLNMKRFGDLCVIDVNLKEWKLKKEFDIKQIASTSNNNFGGFVQKLSDLEKSLIQSQLMSMGFTDEQIESVMKSATSFDQALAMLLK